MIVQSLLYFLAAQFHHVEGDSAKWSAVAPEDFPTAAALKVKSVRDAIICGIAASSNDQCRLFCFNSSSVSCSLYEFPVSKPPYSCTENCRAYSTVCYQEPLPSGVFIGNGVTTFTPSGPETGDISALDIYNLPMTHTWRWMMPSSYVLEINFHFIDIEYCGCACSSLVLRDVQTYSTIDGNLFCGAYQSFSTTVQMNEVELFFQSDGSTTLPGFELDYKCYKVYQCDTELTVLTEEAGEIYVSNVPSTFATCTWSLQMPPGKLLKLTFDYFDLGPCCECAFLFLIDAGFPYFPLTGGELCSTYEPETLQASVSNFLDIVLSTDGSNVLPGFRILYETIQDPTRYYCDGDQVLTTAPGIIRANDTDYYSTNINCTWIITMAPGSRIAIFFDWFQTEEGFDQLTIMDTSTQTYLGPSPMYGQIRQSLLTSTGNEVILTFESDSIINDFGFHLYYYVV